MIPSGRRDAKDHLLFACFRNRSRLRGRRPQEREQPASAARGALRARLVLPLRPPPQRDLPQPEDGQGSAGSTPAGAAPLLSPRLRRRRRRRRNHLNIVTRGWRFFLAIFYPLLGRPRKGRRLSSPALGFSICLALAKASGNR
jgi:hypothetical protein